MMSSSSERIDPFEGSAGQQADFESLRSEIAGLRAYIDERIATHFHGGSEGQQIRFDTDLVGLIEVVSAAPSGTPQAVYDQVKIYVNGTTYRLYWYDWNGQAWHYVTATA